MADSFFDSVDTSARSVGSISRHIGNACSQITTAVPESVWAAPPAAPPRATPEYIRPGAPVSAPRYFVRLPCSDTTEAAIDAATAAGAVQAPRLHGCQSEAVVGCCEVER